jgi:hypothetical protein
MATHPRPYERAIFWLGMGGAVAVIGGIILSVGLIQSSADPKASLWSNRWFLIGFGIVVVGAIMLLLALKLYLWPSRRISDRAASANTAIVNRPSGKMRLKQTKIDGYERAVDNEGDFDSTDLDAGRDHSSGGEGES